MAASLFRRDASMVRASMKLTETEFEDPTGNC